MEMDWLVVLEIVIVAIAIGVSVYRIIESIKESKLLPLILDAIEDAETQDGLKNKEKLDYALEYIKKEATTQGITIDLAKTVKLIERLVLLTKKVNFK